MFLLFFIINLLNFELILGLEKVQTNLKPLYSFSDEYIEHINQNAKTWQAGRNFPSDITEEYLRNHIIGNTSHFEIPQIDISDRKLQDPLYISEDSIPESFDARQQWPNCKSIKNIPNIGSCAAPHIFAAVASFADRLCIKNNGKTNVELSSEYLISCCKICRYYEQNVCSPGSVYKTWHFLHKRGAVTGSSYPENTGCQPSTVKPCSHYGEDPSLPECKNVTNPNPKCHTRCTNNNYNIGFFRDKHRATEVYWVNDKENDIKKEILAYGPTTATFVLYDDFYHYKSGIYKHTNNSISQMYFHSAKLIGWGIENKIPYWLLINTWGSKWGNNGTFKIIRDTYECDMEYLIAAGIPKY